MLSVNFDVTIGPWRDVVANPPTTSIIPDLQPSKDGEDRPEPRSPSKPKESREPQKQHGLQPRALPPASCPISRPPAHSVSLGFWRFWTLTARASALRTKTWIGSPRTSAASRTCRHKGTGMERMFTDLVSVVTEGVYRAYRAYRKPTGGSGRRRPRCRSAGACPDIRSRARHRTRFPAGSRRRTAPPPTGSCPG